MRVGSIQSGRGGSSTPKAGGIPNQPRRIQSKNLAEKDPFCLGEEGPGIEKRDLFPSEEGFVQSGKGGSSQDPVSQDED
jgi:hypothetical protein